MDKSLFSKAKLYWKSPPPGRYMSYKEIMSLSGGGIGIRFIGYCIGPMMLSVGNTLIGNTIGIEPKAMFILYVLGIIASIPLTGLRAYMVDNARSMQGKYRPYLIKMGLPSAILGIAFIWFPYERVSMAVKCVVVLLFNIGFQFFYSFMNDAYDSLLNVLSPNTVERTDVASVKSIVENLSPSIANIFLPIAAKLITGENTLYDIRVYRALYPPMLIVGFVISLVIYLNTEEKIVQARTHAVQISFADAFKAVARNKYFWVLSLAGWIGFLEGSYNNIMGWMYNYRNSCTPGQYSLITTISGNASFWPNIIAPIAIRTVGKKKVLVYTNLMSVGLILLMLPITENSSAPWAIWVLLICNFVNTLVTGLGHQMNPSLNADIRDYQQYITGERIDGMFSTVGLIGSIITLMGSGVLPAIYDRAGLNHATAISLGFDGSNVYDVLYSEAHFSSICSVLVIASAVGAALNVIPYFFYDLTENRQRAMVSVLKIRAFFEDYGNGKLSDRELVDTVDIIREAEEYCKKKAVVLSKSGIRAAKKKRRQGCC